MASGAQAANAQSTQMNDGSTVNIEQVGPDNLAIVSSSGRSTANINQTGRGNTATIITDGRGNGELSGTIDQNGDNNETLGTIEGDDNQYIVEQTSSGAANIANFSQLGSQNDIDIVQDATGLTEGFANSAEVLQTGLGNYASLDQTALNSGVSFYSNMAKITQDGEDNLASSTQNGNNNRSEQEQVGDNNVSNILQTGDDNLAIHRQFGDNLSVPDYYGGTQIQQTGGASVKIEQYDAFTMPFGPPG